MDLLSCEFEASLLYRASSRTEKQVEGEEREENRRWTTDKVKIFAKGIF